MNPLLSIIIPVYNAAPYLRECLGSILAHNYSGWEVICVDDGSVDASGDILDEFSATDSRVRVFHQQNAGVSAARNKALGEAKGEYVLVVDADDMIVPDVCMRAIKNMKSQDLDFCSLARHYPWATFDANIGSTCKILFGGVNCRGASEIGDAVGVLRKIGMSSSGVIYYREFVERFNIRYPKGINWNEDFVFITSLVLHGAKFGVYDEIGYKISSHKDSLSHRRGQDVVLSMNRAANIIMDMMREVRVSKKVARYYAGMNKYEIFYKWCRATAASIRKFNCTYGEVLTIQGRLLNNIIALCPWAWFGKLGVLRIVNSMLEHFNLYYSVSL